MICSNDESLAEEGESSGTTGTTNEEVMSNIETNQHLRGGLHHLQAENGNFAYTIYNVCIWCMLSDVQNSIRWMVWRLKTSI